MTRRSTSPKRTQDRFGRQAKKEGYPARSIYKLEEIDRRVQLLRPGMRVMDLGAYPGSWSLYAGKRVGPTGRVISYDTQEMPTQLGPNIEAHTQDVTTLSAAELTQDGAFDVVLSDMAPATSGTRFADQYRSYELFMFALELARHISKPGGAFVGKIFQGAEFQQAHTHVKQIYKNVRIIKPESSRKESTEVFIVGLGQK